MENTENVTVEDTEVVETENVTEAPVAETSEAVEETAVAVADEETADTSEDSEAPVSKGKKFIAGVKEWGRKQIVSLKRKPQNIVLVFQLIVTLVYLLSLNTLSPGPVNDFRETSWLGLCVFVNALFSILVLVLLLNIFPKYPKVNKRTGKKRYVNVVMIVLSLAFMAIMVIMDLVYYHVLTGEIAGNETIFFNSAEHALKYRQYWGPSFSVDKINIAHYKSYLTKAFSVCIAHVILVAISAMLLATLPLYRRLINLINTKKEIADNNMKEAIDIED